MPLPNADWLLSEKINNPLLWLPRLWAFALNGQAIYCMKSAVIVEPHSAERWRQLSPNHQRERKVRFHSLRLWRQFDCPGGKEFYTASQVTARQSKRRNSVSIYTHPRCMNFALLLYVYIEEANIWQRARVTNWCCTRAPSNLPGQLNCVCALRAARYFRLLRPTLRFTLLKSKLPNLPRRYFDNYLYLKSLKGWAPFCTDSIAFHLFALMDFFNILIRNKFFFQLNCLFNDI
jgi:hypothetical protein